jgi:hypothetical protein
LLRQKLSLIKTVAIDTPGGNLSLKIKSRAQQTTLNPNKKPDNGNGIVIINRSGYKSRMFDILKDNTKFEQLKIQKSNIYKETVKREDKVCKLLNELKNEELISEQQHDELMPIGSRPGILYGLPKVIILIFQ